MKQEFDSYTPEDHDVWGILFERQVRNLQERVCPRYLECLDQLKPVLHAGAIPRFEQLDAMLMDATGWSIQVVPGLIPVEDFFRLLARKRFCSSTWLRSRAMLDYLEEPDMFHDIFGHIPLLMDPEYAHFIQRLGALGVRYAAHAEIIDQLERLYWYTVEFGLLRSGGQVGIYGSGIVSSYGETNHIFEDEIRVDDFELERVLHTPFTTTEIQTQYFALSDLGALYGLCRELEEHFERALVQ